ncbi:MAG: Formamidopyrimidine-DNA glycosylase [uncultured Frankineae bacterium]|uniref:Formamidopyrimidine-DNA glycosylase n=1 Tax=uncultured Frankineae bacterium TaxID=437475 RepID=A0A6J4MDR4_9ACTN|nr:MAG: Formamidopyrimidine-DNA glycosylase [uncultured Frankineae bacterium]
MPELPEVEALASFLRERAVGRVVARVDVVSIAVLKTYDPPATALGGLEVTSVARHGKFLDLVLGEGSPGDGTGLHLVTHLARAGWLQWREELPTAPPRMGKGPIGLRVHLDDGSGFDLTEAGTKKGLAVYLVRDLHTVPGVARLGVDPLPPAFTEQVLAAFDRTDHFVLPATLDVPSIKNLKLTLETLDLLSYPRERRHVALNRSDAKVGLSIADVEKTLQTRIELHIPSHRAVPASMNRGVPIALDEPGHAVSRVIRTFAETTLVPRTTTPPSHARTRRISLRRRPHTEVTT